MEAFSRGMESMIVFECDKAAQSCIQKNFDVLNKDGNHKIHFSNNSKLHQWEDELRKLLAQAGQEKLDVVFCDPPYDKGYLQKLCQGLLAQKDFWKPGCLLYIEAGFREEAPQIHGWELVKEKRRGASAQLYYLFA